jgi:hypothetical protein
LFLNNMFSCCSVFHIHLPHPNKIFKFCALLTLSHVTFSHWDKLLAIFYWFAAEYSSLSAQISFCHQHLILPFSHATQMQLIVVIHTCICLHFNFLTLQSVW